MLKHFLIFLCMSATSVTSFAQTKASDVLSVAQRANDYFMAKYEDPTVPTNHTGSGRRKWE